MGTDGDPLAYLSDSVASSFPVLIHKLRCPIHIDQLKCNKSNLTKYNIMIIVQKFDTYKIVHANTCEKTVQTPHKKKWCDSLPRWVSTTKQTWQGAYLKDMTLILQKNYIMLSVILPTLPPNFTHLSTQLATMGEMLLWDSDANLYSYKWQTQMNVKCQKEKGDQVPLIM